MNWKKLLDALTIVESRGDFHAVGDNGLAVGVLQCHPDVVTDVNTIYGLYFKFEDRLDIWRSRIICVLYTSHYCRFDRINREPTSQDYALCWHYGPDYKLGIDPDGYWDKVRVHIN